MNLTYEATSNKWIVCMCENCFILHICILIFIYISSDYKYVVIVLVGRAVSLDEGGGCGGSRPSKTMLRETLP